MLLMNSKSNPLPLSLRVITCVVALTAAGCASTGEKPANETAAAGNPSGKQPSKFKTDDGRIIDIGKASASNGGRTFKNPHLEKCWIAEGFDFKGYETLYVAPVLSTAKHQPDEEMPLQVAREYLPVELGRAVAPKKLFANIVTNAADIKPGARTLKLEETITDYSKGGGAARYFAGLYGGGQPVIRVQGVMTDGDKTVFTFQARRSGVSGGARMFGVAMKDTDIQAQDIQSLVLDLTDFMSAIAGQYQPAN